MSKTIYKLPFDANTNNAPLRVDKVRVKWEDDGVVAEAEVSYPIGDGSRRIEWFSSAGLYGIDYDNEHIDYLLRLEVEQVEDLRQHLARFGIVLPRVEGLV